MLVGETSLYKNANIIMTLVFLYSAFSAFLIPCVFLFSGLSAFSCSQSCPVRLSAVFFCSSSCFVLSIIYVLQRTRECGEQENDENRKMLRTRERGEKKRTRERREP